MYWGNLSEDEYGTQQFLADLRLESVTVAIDPDTNYLYNIESNHYGFSRIQYQRSVINWILREYGNIEVQYETLDIQIGEELYAHCHLRDLWDRNMDILCIYHDDAWYPPQVSEYSYDWLICFRHVLHGFQID